MLHARPPISAFGLPNEHLNALRRPTILHLLRAHFLSAWYVRAIRAIREWLVLLGRADLLDEVRAR